MKEKLKVVEGEKTKAEIESDAVIGMEKIKAIGHFFDFIGAEDFWDGHFADFARNMGEVIGDEIKKVEAGFFQG